MGKQMVRGGGMGGGQGMGGFLGSLMQNPQMMQMLRQRQRQMQQQQGGQQGGMGQPNADYLARAQSQEAAHPGSVDRRFLQGQGINGQGGGMGQQFGQNALQQQQLMQQGRMGAGMGQQLGQQGPMSGQNALMDFQQRGGTGQPGMGQNPAFNQPNWGQNFQPIVERYQNQADQSANTAAQPDLLQQAGQGVGNFISGLGGPTSLWGRLTGGGGQQGGPPPNSANSYANIMDRRRRNAGGY